MSPCRVGSWITFVLLAACGNSGTNKLADSGIDGPRAIDGASIDAALAPVTIGVTQDGSASAGVAVYFLNADSSVVSSATTDAAGSASALMVAGGSVTALVSVASGALPTQVYTYADVKPGDALHLDVGADELAEVTFDITVPNDPAQDHYDLSTPCGQANIAPETLAAETNNPPVSVTLGCGSATDALITASNLNNPPLESIYAPNLALANGVPVTIPGPYVPVTSARATFTDVDADTVQIVVRRRLFSARGQVFELRQAAFANVTDGSGSAAYDFPPASQVPGTTQVMVSAVAANANGAQSIVEWGPPSDTYALDVGSAEIANFANTPSVQPASHQVAWSVGTGRSADIALANIRVSRPGGAVAEWVWEVAAPATLTGGAQLPTLPTDVTDYNIAGTDNVTIDDLTIATVPGGYDKARPFAFDTDFFAAPTGSTSGRAAVVDYSGDGLRAMRAGGAVTRRRSDRPRPAGVRRTATARPARAP